MSPFSQSPFQYQEFFFWHGLRFLIALWVLSFITAECSALTAAVVRDPRGTGINRVTLGGFLLLDVSWSFWKCGKHKVGAISVWFCFLTFTCSFFASVTAAEQRHFKINSWNFFKFLMESLGSGEKNTGRWDKVSELHWNHCWCEKRRHESLKGRVCTLKIYNGRWISNSFISASRSWVVKGDTGVLLNSELIDDELLLWCCCIVSTGNLK